ncbi:MAG: ester cyclase [Gammaproteobacteria bacterium]|nr:ester cyclase [Gammaproteobacteria bacterium]
MRLIEKISHFHKVLWDEKNTNVIFDLFTEDVKIHSPLNTMIGPQALKDIIDTWLTAFPDLTVTWGEILASTDKVVATWEATGTHKGVFLDIAPTGKTIFYHGTTIYDFTEDKISEYWALVDIDEIKNQLI